MRRNGWWVATLLASALAIAAGGCTDSQMLDSGTTDVRFEFVAVGDTIQDFDCALINVGSIKLFPLDGLCDVDSTNAGDPCFTSTSCIGGTCEGSSAADIITPNGVFVIEGTSLPKGNLYGTACDATLPELDPLVTAIPFVNPAPFVLSSGLYQISTMTVVDIGLFKDGVELPPDPDSFDVRVCNLNIQNVVGLLGDALRFTVDAGASKVVRFELRADVLESVFVLSPSDTANCPALVDNFEDIFVCTTCDAGVAPGP